MTYSPLPEAASDLGRFQIRTCLKKCYFETYRFSEDLDFTLRDESHLHEAFLRHALSEVVAWVAEESGLTMPPEQLGSRPRPRTPQVPSRWGLGRSLAPNPRLGDSEDRANQARCGWLGREGYL
ncbi:MAG: nucleotidyl transferase AbiEii/AbiGii toxin family protein [Gammaproteobacteria bacterium]